MPLQLSETARKEADIGFTATTQEITRARQVQRRLLRPTSPSVENIDYEGRSLAARGISGDYFDFLAPRPGLLSVAVGDVSGKGISAALMMATLQASLRTSYGTGKPDLVPALTLVNDVFRQATASRHYASLFLGEFDVVSQRLRYINCGHVSPLLLRSGGRVERLEPTTTVLGLFERWTPVIRECRLSAGDTLLAFSDGITEAANSQGEDFGERRLMDVALHHRWLPVPDLMNELLSVSREFCGPVQNDDMTLVVARVNRQRSQAVSAGRPDMTGSMVA